MHVSWPFAVSAAYPLIQNINFDKQKQKQKQKQMTDVNVQTCGYIR